MNTTPSWEKLLLSNKLGDIKANSETGRTPFSSDQDKIIFSGAFRRLAKKTQVHPLAKNDHVHNRLTHSLEVSRVGRTLGLRVGEHILKQKNLPDGLYPSDIGDIVQATCLAHDIGNPPFGHTGEEAIRDWFSSGPGGELIAPLSPAQQADLQQFEGNAQGLRVLCNSEYFVNEGGMRLTYATLAAFIKYPWTSELDAPPKAGKFGVFQSSLAHFSEISAKVGLVQLADKNHYVRHPLVHLMEVADDFCYGLLDLEDGMEMGLLSWDEYYDIVEPILPSNQKLSIAKKKHLSVGRKAALVRGDIISRCIQSATDAFIQYETDLIQGSKFSLIELCDAKVADYVKNTKTTAKERIFTHPAKIELEIGAYGSLATILEVMTTAAKEYVDYKMEGRNISFKSRRVIALLKERSFPGYEFTKDHNKSDVLYSALTRVLDFVSGMTDNYAAHITKQFNGMGS